MCTLVTLKSQNASILDVYFIDIRTYVACYSAFINKSPANSRAGPC